MLSGNIIAWLNQHVVLGNDTRKLYGTFMPTNFEMPSILIPDAQVTGSGN
jgi:predicted Zn-dependent protease